MCLESIAQDSENFIAYLKVLHFYIKSELKIRVLSNKGNYKLLVYGDCGAVRASGVLGP